jgi:DNA-binding beta-propeller fold protein YncE
VSPDGKSVYVASFYSDAVARLKRNPTTGAIRQPVGVGGCVSETGGGPCADGHGLDNPWAVAVSPDGKSVYVGTEKSHTVARLKRNPSTGAIRQPAGAAGCISDTEYGAEPCADGHRLVGPRSVEVSPDGKSVYVASYYSRDVARLKRNPTTGAIAQPAGTAGCISEPDDAEPCADGHALDFPTGVAVSPDGRNVYVSFDHGVARLNRNRTTGAIAQPPGTAGCITENELSGPCADGHGLVGPNDVAVSLDGKNVYVVSSAYSGVVARLNRNATTGAITQPAGTAGCIYDQPYPYEGEPCAEGHALTDPSGVAVSPDGKSVYVASRYSNAVARFKRSR